MTITRFGAAFAVATLFVSPVAAQTPAQGRIALGDLRLDRATDVATLDRRIARMAAQVCGTASDADLVGKNAVVRCQAETIASAAPQRAAAIAAARQYAARAR